MLISNTCYSLLFGTSLLLGQTGESRPFPGSTVDSIVESTDTGNKFIVTMSNKPPFYSPNELRITAGDIVLWRNLGNSDTHTAVDVEGVFTSIDIPPAKEWGFKFLLEGEYEYRCRYHPWMRGRVVVSKRTAGLFVEPLPPLDSIDLRVGRNGTLWVLGSKNRRLWVCSRRALDTAWKTTAAPIKRKELVSFWADDASAWLVSKKSLLQLNQGNGTWREFVLPWIGERMTMMTSDTTLWIVNAKDGEIQLWSIGNGDIVSARISTENESIRQIEGSNKHVLWLLLKSRNVLFSFDAVTNKSERYDLPKGAYVGAMAARNDTLWFTDLGRGKITRLSKGWKTEYTVKDKLRLGSLALNGKRIWSVSAEGDLICLEGGQVQGLSLTNKAKGGFLKGDDQSGLWLVDDNILTKVLIESPQNPEDLSKTTYGTIHDPSRR